MGWFDRDKAPKGQVVDKKLSMPEGLWIKCTSCGEILYRKEVARSLNVCPNCNYHFRISALERIGLLVDEGSFEELFSDVVSANPLKFRDEKDYDERLAEACRKSAMKEAVICGQAKITGQIIVLAVMDFAFMGGSMGSAVGEKVTRAIERAIEQRVGLIIISASGGARMQEGLFSLMQMAKTTAALARLSEAGLLYISILTDPTTGGVTASYAMLGDVILAEPKALVGFAGPRVIEQTIRQKLPEGFQRSEYLFKHGMVDMIVERKHLRDTLALLLQWFC
ncbi:MAG: acetyl-CoA carboxylase, carboxyltransferase subunit beta [Thermodesulfobacteriota bacterium]